MTSISSGRLGPTTAFPLHRPWARLGAAAIGASLSAAFCLLVLLVQRFDAPAVLVGLAALPAVLLLLLRPELATVATVFVLYTNLPAILTRRHGVPVAVAGLFILLLAAPLAHHLLVRRERLRLDATFGLMLAYLGVVLLSALVAREPRLTLDYASRFVVEGLLIYLLVVNVVRSHATLRRVVWAVLAAGALLGALSSWQEVTGSLRQEFGGLAERNVEFRELRRMDREDPQVRELIEAWSATHGPSGRSQRAYGPTDEPNRFAQVLVVLLPLALLGYRTAGGRVARAAAALAGLLVLGGLACAASRGAFVTLAALTLLAAGMRWIPRSRLVLGAALAMLVAPLVAPSLVARVASLGGVTRLVQDGAASSADGAIKGRAAAMVAAARVFADHPVLGVGAGHFQPHYSAEYQQNDPRFRFREARSYHAHSLYIQLGAELGVIGLVAFLAIFAVQLRALDRERRRWAAVSPERAHLATAFFLSVLGYLGTSAFLHLGFQRYLWLLVALASAALHLLRNEAATGTRLERVA